MSDLDLNQIREKYYGFKTDDEFVGLPMRSRKPVVDAGKLGGKIKLGVGQFLSNNRKTSHLVRFVKGVVQDVPVEFDSLSGKYVLICCFYLPISHPQERIPRLCRALIDAYDHLSKSSEFPFELVVVVNMRSPVYDLKAKAAFDHFYSSLSFSCLAIPFSDFATCDYIHSSIRSTLVIDSDHPAILVDPEGNILHRETAIYHFWNYGSESFPFLPTTLDEIEKQDYLLRSRLDPYYTIPHYPPAVANPLSLSDDILNCPPLLRLYRVGDQHGELSSSTVLDLSTKYVGLYLFINGDIMKNIKAAHDRCLKKSQELEILLVPLAFYDEPKAHNDQLLQSLSSLGIKSWFLFSCPTNVSRRLRRIFGHGYTWPGEKFIIIPPGCQSGELLGRAIIVNMGSDVYPFTQTAILKQRLEYFKSLTPIFSSSLFNNCRITQNGKEFNPEQLQGKNVLLYLSWTQCARYVKKVKNRYREIKQWGCELVFVHLNYTSRYWNKELMNSEDDSVCEKCPCFNSEKMPWPCYSLDSAKAKASIKNQLFFPEDFKLFYMFAIRKDGKIVSRDVYRKLVVTRESPESLFEDVLETEFARGLAGIRPDDVFV